MVILGGLALLGEETIGLDTVLEAVQLEESCQPFMPVKE